MMQKNGTGNRGAGLVFFLCLTLLCTWQYFRRHRAIDFPVLARPFAWVDSWLEEDG